MEFIAVKKFREEVNYLMCLLLPFGASVGITTTGKCVNLYPSKTLAKRITDCEYFPFHREGRERRQLK